MVNLPAWHAKQLVWPTPGLYLPEGQSMQLLSLLLPVTWLYVPAEQSTGAVMPSSGLYVPSGASTQQSIPS